MNRVMIPLLALIVGGFAGAAGFSAMQQPEPAKPTVADAPSLDLSEQEPDPELAKLRNENSKLKRDLDASRLAAEKPEPVVPEPEKPVVVEVEKPADKPIVEEPTPEIVPEPVRPSDVYVPTPEEALRDILGRTPDEAELAQLERWIKRSPEDLGSIETHISNADASALLKLLDSNRSARALDLLKDPEKFEAMFQRKTAEVRMTGAEAKEATLIPDGAVIEFAEGFHTLDLATRYRDEFPKDILIRGAGMDKTQIRIGELTANSGLTQLHFEDLTIDCNNKYMLDLRREEPTTIRAKHVRFVRFDMGAGGSCLFSSRSLAFYGSDCEFVSGYGKMPVSGTPFRSNGVFLIRVENSVFSGYMPRIYSTRNKQRDADDFYGQGECYITGSDFIDCLPDETEKELVVENCTYILNNPSDIENWLQLTDKQRLSHVRSAAIHAQPKSLREINTLWQDD